MACFLRDIPYLRTYILVVNSSEHGGTYTAVAPRSANDARRRHIVRADTTTLQSASGRGQKQAGYWSTAAVFGLRTLLYSTLYHTSIGRTYSAALLSRLFAESSSRSFLNPNSSPDVVNVTRQYITITNSSETIWPARAWTPPSC